MFNNKFKEVIENLEKNIKNKKDLEYVKTLVTDLALTYLEELGKLEEVYDKKVTICEERLEDLEQTMEKIDNEIYEDEDSDLEPINCPYCNTKFLIEFDNTNTEVRCPDCRNIIELDWENFEDDN